MRIPEKKLVHSVGFTPMTSEIREQYSNIEFKGAISRKSRTNECGNEFDNAGRN